MKKILAIFFAACFMFTCFACGNKEVVDNGGDNTEKGGGYYYHLDATENFIVKNGASDYKIVIPKNNTNDEKTAAEELSMFFREATGITLPTVNENKYTGGNAIYLGNTEYKEKHDGSYDQNQLGEGGFRIKTVGKDIVIYGLTGKGTIYGIYSFLTDTLNFESFTQNYYYIEENVMELPVYNYDVTDVPDIPMRIIRFSHYEGDQTAMNRIRTTSMYQFFETFGGGLFHNTFGVLPKETYQADHPKWYATDGLNLCFAARGDKAEYELMMETIVDALKVYIAENQDSKYITFTHEDNQAWCACEACSQSSKHYGANSAVLVKFMNDLRTRIDEWFATDGAEYKIDFDLVFFAYHATNAAPAKLNAETGKYEPVDNSVVCIDGVVPYFAESNGDYTHSFYEDENRIIAENLKAWTVCADKILSWIYGANFSFYFTIYDSFSAAPDTYKFLAENGVHTVFEEQAGGDGVPPAFGVLKTFLFSKLTWDVNADRNELYDRFFTLYFRDAADEMREFFDAYRQLSTIQKEQMGYGGGRSIFSNAANKPDLWPQRTLIQWNEKINDAFDAIDYLKETDMELYNKLYDNICADRQSVLYMLVYFYSEKFSDEELASMKKSFYDDTVRLGHSSLTNVYQALGIN